MGYEFVAMDDLGDQDMVCYQTQNYDAAHALLGALDVPFEATDKMGSGDEYLFTDAELSAAEAALTSLIMPAPGETEGLIFLATVREEMKQKGIDTCHILIC